MARVVVFALSALLLARCGAGDPYCERKTGASSKPLPDLDVAAFTVEYRAIMQDKKYTMWAKESYDSVNNKARLDAIKAGIEQSLLIDYADNTYIYYEYLDKPKEEYICKIEKLDEVKDDNLDLLGFKTKKSSSGSKVIPHVVSASNVLQFAKTLGEEYIDDDSEIDGLPVDHWQSCVTWDDANTTFTLDYYFTKEDFKPRDKLTPKQVPVRADVQGVIDKGDAKVDFHHVYEFLDFRAFSELPPETFSLPEFMVCVGSDSEWKRKFPDMPKSIAYTVETAVQTDGGDMMDVDTVTIHNDDKNKIIRVDQRGSTSISDFRTGVQYFMNENGCKVRAIDPILVNSAIDEDGVIKMRDRPEMKYIKMTNFSFTGVKIYRGVSSWGYVTFEDLDQIEVYFTNNTGTPLGVKISHYYKEIVVHHNIFNFGRLSDRTNENPFDVQRCINTEDILDVTVMFTTENPAKSLADFIATADRSRADSLRNRAAEIAEVSPLQIISNDIHFHGTDLYWMIRILGKDSILKQANVQNRLAVKSPMKVYIALKIAVEKGRFAYTSDNIDYKGVSCSRSSEIMKLNVESDIKYKFKKISGKCVKKFVKDAGFSTQNNVHECAQSCTDSRNVACNFFEYVESTKSCQMSWAENLPDLVDSKSCSLFRQNYLGHFKLFKGTVLLEDADKLYQTADNAEDCAKLCMEDTGFACESFDFCSDEKRCYMHDTHFFSKETRTGKDGNYESCEHYSRDHDEFNDFWKTDLDAPLVAEVESDNYFKCAYLCTKDEDGCLAFSYCPPTSGKKVGTCKLLPSSQAGKVTFKPVEELCVLGIAPGLKGIALRKALRSGNLTLGGSGASEGSKYSGVDMFGLAVAMVLAGSGLAGLVYFLLRRFNVWGGF